MSTYCKHADSCKTAEKVQKEVFRVVFAIPENNIKGNHRHMNLMLGCMLCIIPQRLDINVAVHVLLLPDVFCSV